MYQVLAIEEGSWHRSNIARKSHEDAKITINWSKLDFCLGATNRKSSEFISLSWELKKVKFFDIDRIKATAWGTIDKCDENLLNWSAAKWHNSVVNVFIIKLCEKFYAYSSLIA